MIGVTAMVPYLQLQPTGLGSIIEETSYGAVPRNVAIVLGAVALAAYVVISGIHPAAWNAVIKVSLVLAVVVTHRHLPAGPLLRRDRRAVHQGAGDEPDVSAAARAVTRHGLVRHVDPGCRRSGSSCGRTTSGRCMRRRTPDVPTRRDWFLREADQIAREAR